MATTSVVCVFVLLLILRELHGELSLAVRRELISRVISGQAHDKEIRVDYVLFKRLRMMNNSTLIADYEIDSNDVMVEFPRTGTVQEKLPASNLNENYQYPVPGKSAQYEHNSHINSNDVEQSTGNELHDYRYESIKNKIDGKKLNEVTIGTKDIDKYDSHIPDKEFDRKQNIEVLLIKTIGKQTTRSSFLDKVVDMLLKLVRFELHETGRDEIALPDVDESFSTQILFIPVKGEFKAENGWFKNLSTVYRTGEVVTTTGRRKITLECDLGLRVMQFGYRSYHAELLGIGVSGSLTGTIAADSIDFKISLAYVNGSCVAHLDSLKVTRLSGIDVTLTGWEGFGWLLSFIGNCVSGSYREKIISAVEQMLSQVVEEKLQNFNCNHLIPIML